ncbi:MAG TPA: hypothetical protein PLS96_12410, partial [Myxococcota bacterium]|nr:hypothetical protein [Myxococcota bacterium]
RPAPSWSGSIHHNQFGKVVVIQQAMLDLIDGALGFIGDLLEAPPDQDGAADMIRSYAVQRKACTLGA